MPPQYLRQDVVVSRLLAQRAMSLVFEKPYSRICNFGGSMPQACDTVKVCNSNRRIPRMLPTALT